MHINFGTSERLRKITYAQGINSFNEFFPQQFICLPSRQYVPLRGSDPVIGFSVGLRLLSYYPAHDPFLDAALAGHALGIGDKGNDLDVILREVIANRKRGQVGYTDDGEYVW